MGLEPRPASAHDRTPLRSITEIKEFPNRPHFPAVPGWEEVADYALEWAAEHAVTPATAAAGDA